MSLTQEEAFELIKNMGRTRCRYLLYRVRNQSKGGSDHEKPTKAEGITLKQFKKFFEEQSSFTRFEDFAENWDVPSDKVVKPESKNIRPHRREPSDFMKIEWPGPVAVARLRGELSEWNDVVRANAVTLPSVVSPFAEKAD